MALKDNWIDRQNGIDNVDSEDINKVARAVIEAEKRLDDVGIGATFFPYVSESGIISWTNDGGLPNPPPINIKGDKGDDGYTPQKGTDYWNAKDVQEIHSYVDDQISPLMQEINGVEEELRMINEGGVE